MCQVAVGFASEWPTAKEELVGTYTEGPPVDGVCIAALRENLWCHVGHASCDTSKQATFGVMYSDVEVCEMGMATLVEEDVVGLEIAKRE